MGLYKFTIDFKKAREAASMTQERVAGLLNVCREEIDLIEFHGHIPKVKPFLLSYWLFGLNPMKCASKDELVHPQWAAAVPPGYWVIHFL